MCTPLYLAICNACRECSFHLLFWFRFFYSTNILNYLSTESVGGFLVMIWDVQGHCLIKNTTALSRAFLSCLNFHYLRQSFILRSCHHHNAISAIDIYGVAAMYEFSARTEQILPKGSSLKATMPLTGMLPTHYCLLPYWRSYSKEMNT